MDEKQTQKITSLAITTQLGQYINLEKSKLAELQQFHKPKATNAQNLISQSGKLLTRKIFGANIKCMKRNPHPKQLAFSANLLCLAQVLLHVCFKDQYVLTILLQQLHQDNDQYFTKMLRCFNPFKTLRINGTDIHIILIQIIIKLNSKRTTETLNNILKNYSLASQMYSILLRMILLRNNIITSQNICEQLHNTDDIYSFICDYFGMNSFTHCAKTLRRKNNLNDPNQVKLGDKSRVYLFNQYNMFISTPDNQEFCCGNYYSSQEDLLKGESQIRKSTLDYLKICKETFQREDINESIQNQDKFDDATKSLELDLGMSNSGFVFGNQNNDTPYFNSNPDTPQFGQLLDSARFKKSLDFQSALKMAEKTKAQKLGTVEEQINSPMSDGQKFHFGKNNTAKLFYGEQKLNDSVHFQQQEIPILKIKESPAKKSQSQNFTNKPGLSSFSEQHKKLQSFAANNGKESKKQLKIPVMEKKSLISNSDMKTQLKYETDYCEKYVKQLANVIYKESHRFLKNQQTVKKQEVKKKRQSRKYSVNENSMSPKKSEKNYVHYSNHFNNAEEQIQKDQKESISISPKKFIGKNIVWEDRQTDNLSVQKKKTPRKMQIISRAVDQKFHTKTTLKNYSPFKSKTPDHKTKMEVNEANSSKNNHYKNYKQWKQLGKLELKKYASDKSFKNKLSEPKKLIRTLTLKQQVKNNNLNEKLYLGEVEPSLTGKKSPRSVKSSKFPQFLKKSKSRNNLVQQNKEVNFEKQERKQKLQMNLSPHNLPEKLKNQQNVQSKYYIPQYTSTPKISDSRPVPQMYTNNPIPIPTYPSHMMPPSFKKDTQQLKNIRSQPNLNNIVFQNYATQENRNLHHKNKPWENCQPNVEIKNSNRNLQYQFNQPTNIQQQQQKMNYAPQDRVYYTNVPFQQNSMKNSDFSMKKQQHIPQTQQFYQPHQHPQPQFHPYSYQNGHPHINFPTNYINKKGNFDTNIEKQRERDKTQNLVSSKMFSTKAQTVYTEQPGWRSDGFRFMGYQDVKNWKFV